MHNGELAKKYQVAPLTRKECATKLRVMYLQSKCCALGWKHCCIVVIWLNSSISDDLRTNAFSTSTKCKSQGKYIFWICWSSLLRHYKKLGWMYISSLFPSQVP